MEMAVPSSEPLNLRGQSQVSSGRGGERMKGGRPDVEMPSNSTRGLRFPTQATGVEAYDATPQHGKDGTIPEKAQLRRPTVSGIAPAHPADSGPGNSSVRLSDAFAPPPVRQTVSFTMASMPNPLDPARPLPSSPARASVKSNVSPGRSYAAIAAEQRAKKTREGSACAADADGMGEVNAPATTHGEHTMRGVGQTHALETAGVHREGKDDSMGSAGHVGEDGVGRTPPRGVGELDPRQKGLRPKGGLIVLEDLGFSFDPGHDAMLAGVHAAETSLGPQGKGNAHTAHRL
jgi:hypothetical protein